MTQQTPDSPTNGVQLRDVTEADLTVFFQNQLDPEAAQIADVPTRDRDAYMAHWARILADENQVLKTVLFNGRVAGNVVSWNQAGERDVGYWLGKEFWGKGIATQALAAFLKLDTFRPLYAHIAKHNIGSRRVLEKCGFSIHAEDGGDFILILDQPGEENEP